MLAGGEAGPVLRAAVPLLALLALAQGAAALFLGVDAPVPVRAQAGPDGVSAAAADVAVAVDEDVSVAAPLLPDARLPLPVPIELAPAPEAAEAPASRRSAGGLADLPDVPPEIAVPAAAGGVAALLALAARLLGASLSWLPFTGRLFSRIDTPRVLDNATRARLHDLVHARPGLTLEELRAACGIAWGTAVHHLRRLEAHGLVTSTVGARHRFFPANTPSSRHKASLASLAQPTARRIAALVGAAPGIGQEQLCASLGLKAPAASKHLGRFAAQGLVTVRADGRRRLYEPTDELRAALAVAVA